MANTAIPSEDSSIAINAPTTGEVIWRTIKNSMAFTGLDSIVSEIDETDSFGITKEFPLCRQNNRKFSFEEHIKSVKIQAETAKKRVKFPVCTVFPLLNSSENIDTLGAGKRVSDHNLNLDKQGTDSRGLIFYQGKRASFKWRQAGNGNIFAGTNPLIRHHVDEIRLPAKSANIIRERVPNGSTSRRGININTRIPATSRRLAQQQSSSGNLSQYQQAHIINGQINVVITREVRQSALIWNKRRGAA